MKHVNKWPLALYVCVNSIFKCFIGNRMEWSHIEWHYFSNWQVLLIQTSPCYCLLGSIYSPVKMYTRVGKGTLAVLADPGLSGVRVLSLSQPPAPNTAPHWEEDESERTNGMSNALEDAGPVPPHSLGGEYVPLSVPGHVAGCDDVCLHGSRSWRSSEELRVVGISPGS